MLPLLLKRASGGISAEDFRARILDQQLKRMAISLDLEIKGSQRGSINHMDLEAFDSRFLLTAAGDSTIALYDLEAIQNLDGEPVPHVAALCTSQRSPAQDTPRGVGVFDSSVGGGRGHSHSVSHVEWYPQDTGLFISASMDETVKVWDTNQFSIAGTFYITHKVYVATASRIARTHCCIAVGTDAAVVRLCDLTSGGWTHTLMGHTDAVATAKWSPTDEYVLCTGSRDGTVRLWDIRRSGAAACLLSFDYHSDHTSTLHPGSLANTPSSNSGSANSTNIRIGIRSSGKGMGKAHNGPVASVAFMPDGRYLLSAGLDKRMRLWDIGKGIDTRQYFLHTRNMKREGWELHVIQQGQTSSAHILYPCGENGNIAIYRVHKDFSEPIKVLKGHLDTVNTFAYRPVQHQIITGGSDSLLLIWDNSKALAEERARLSEDVEEKPTTVDVDTWSEDEEEEGGGRAGGGFVPPILLMGRGGRP